MAHWHRDTWSMFHPASWSMFHPASWSMFHPASLYKGSVLQPASWSLAQATLPQAAPEPRRRGAMGEVASGTGKGDPSHPSNFPILPVNICYMYQWAVVCRSQLIQKVACLQS